MNKMITTIVRILLGIFVLFFGLNGFFLFMPIPPFPGLGGELIGVMFQAGYFFVIQSIVMIVAGISFLFNKYVPLTAVLLFPFTLNWILFHLFLDLASIPGALIAFILNLYLLGIHLDKYKPMLKA